MQDNLFAFIGICWFIRVGATLAVALRWHTRGRRGRRPLQLDALGGIKLVLQYMQISPGQGHEAGRQLLQRMYRSCTGSQMPPILTTDRGKPYFAQGPLHFSISHTPKHVFCALSEIPIGIDAEEADRAIDLRLAEKILSPMEKAQFAAAPDKRLALLTFWVLKEARAKYTGTGLQGYPNHTQFRLDDPRIRKIDGCLVAVIREDH